MASNGTYVSVESNSTEYSPVCVHVNNTIGSLGIAGNMFVILVILMSSSLKQRLYNLFLLNQSWIDLTVAILIIVRTNLPSADVSSDTFLDEVYYRLWLSGMPLWATMHVSTTNLVFLTIERYLSIVHCMWHKVHVTRNCVLAMLVLVWVIGFIFEMAFVIPATVIRNGHCCPLECRPLGDAQAVFAIVHSIFTFYLPLAIILFCYSRITLMLHQNTRFRRNNNNNNNNKSVGGTMRMESRGIIWTKARRNTIQTMIVVSLVFTLCWIINQVYFVGYNLGYRDDLYSPLYKYSGIAVYLNCCVNPLIYSFKYKHFKDELKRLWARFASIVTQCWKPTSGRSKYGNNRYATSSL